MMDEIGVLLDMARKRCNDIERATSKTDYEELRRLKDIYNAIMNDIAYSFRARWERIKQLEGENEMLKTAVYSAEWVFKKHNVAIDSIIDDPSRDKVICVLETAEALKENEK